MRPIRIGINAIFRGNPTGAANYIINLVNKIAQYDKENEYFIFVTPFNKKWFTYNAPNIHEVICNFKSENPIIRRLWELFLFSQFIKKYNLDIIHCPTNILPPFITCKGIVTFLDCQYFGPDSQNSFLRKEYHHIFMSLTLKKAEKIITLSNTMKKDIMKYFKNIKENDIQVIHLGQDYTYSKNITSQIKSFRKKYGLNRKYLLFVGFPHFRKNLVRLVKAFSIVLKKLPEPYDLVLCGDIQTKIESDYANIAQAIRDEGIEKNVIFIDYIENDELHTLISGAELFVFPTLYEGFGIPVIEAMACKTPVLISDIEIMHEVAGDAAFYIDPYDVNNIADGICKMLSSVSMRKKLAEKGLTIASNYSWDNTVRKTIACYHDIRDCLLKNQ